MIKRRVRLRIASASSQTITFPLQLLGVHCPSCGRDVQMITPVEAAEILEIDSLTLMRLAAAGRIHTIQTVLGSVRVCKESLFASRDPVQ